MKKLSIIIPRYKETEKDLLSLLCSIRMQTNFDMNDLEIIISDDNPNDPISEDNIYNLGLDIRVVRGEVNAGPGVARQIGLDAATGKYVMFFDADDSLYSANAFSLLFQELEKYPETDYMSSNWLEEIYDENTDTMVYVPHDLENTWMHGKIFKRNLIQKNKIKFHPELRVHEDSYFLSLVADAAKSRRLLQSPTYIWRWSENTITRRNEGLYLYEDFPTFIHSITLANEELRRRKSKMLNYHVAQLVIYCFFVLQQEIWLKDDVIEYRKKTVDTLKKEMKDFWDIFDNCDSGFISQIYNDERIKHFKNGEMENYSLYEWVEMLKSN